MSDIAQLARWREDARSRLYAMTLRAIPELARPTGLRAFLLQLAHDVVEPRVAPLRVRGIAQRTWRHNITPSSLTTRMIRADIHTPMEWITAYRAAVIGILLSYSLRVGWISSVLGIESPANVYRIVESASSAAYGPGSYRGKIAKLRRGNADLGFRLFVKPLLPPPHSARWQARIEPYSGERS